MDEPTIIPIRSGVCPVCRPSDRPGTVRVELATPNKIRRNTIPMREMPCPACNGGDLEYVVFQLLAQQHRDDVEKWAKRQPGVRKRRDTAEEATA